MKIKLDSMTLLIIAALFFFLMPVFNLNGAWILVPIGLVLWSIIKSGGGRRG